jgi:hypothetical protein
MLMFGSLGVEVGHWYLTSRQMQGAADAAAISAAAAYIAGEQYQQVGYTYASKNGFCDVNKISGGASACDPHSFTDNVTVTVKPINAQNQIVVDIEQVHSPFFLPIHVSSTPYSCGAVSTEEPCITGHAVVTLKSQSTGGNGCLLGLNKTQTALIAAGNGTINAPSCVAASDTCGGQTACSTPGIAINGNGAVNLAELDVATQQPFSCGSLPPTTCSIPVEKTTYPLWTNDPFSTRVMPSYGSCITNSPTTDTRGVTYYQPGTYCSDIQISGHPNVVFEPGNYILLGSSLSVTGGYVNQRTVASANVATQGTNYKNNDTVTLACLPANCLRAATLKITVQGNKTITGATVTDAGDYINPVPTTLAGTSKTGTGATFNVTFDPDPAPSTCTGNPCGVSFILTATPGGSVGTVKMSNAPISLTAPSDGASSGLVFWQKNCTKTQDCTFSSGNGGNGGTFNGSPSNPLTFTGALYFPGQEVLIAGTAGFQPTNCTAIVADIIDFQGNGSITKGCLPIGGGTTGTSLVYRLTE